MLSYLSLRPQILFYSRSNVDTKRLWKSQVTGSEHVYADWTMVPVGRSPCCAIGSKAQTDSVNVPRSPLLRLRRLEAERIPVSTFGSCRRLLSCEPTFKYILFFCHGLDLIFAQNETCLTTQRDFYDLPTTAIVTKNLLIPTSLPWVYLSFQPDRK